MHLSLLTIHLKMLQCLHNCTLFIFWTLRFSSALVSSTSSILSYWASNRLCKSDIFLSQRAYPKVENRQLIADFHFTVSCSKDIFDFLIEAWWYLWTNCPEVILTFMKFQTPHQEFTRQNLYILLWCKLHRSTSSQLGAKLIFRK